MKKNIIIFIVTFVLSNFILLDSHAFLARYLFPKERTTIPILAGLCDIVGVGRITNVWENGRGVYFSVDSYWRGNPGTDALSVFADTNFMILSDSPMVFFICERYTMTTNDWSRDYGYPQIFERQRLPFYDEGHEQKMRFLEDGLSLFSANDTNLVNFATNLVVAVDTNNTNMFYEIIRDGYNMYPTNSRIHEDSFYTFWFYTEHFTTNFMVEVMWWDPLLQEMPRGFLINQYRRKTGIRIHEVLPEP